jgi:hypothetical protein
MLIDLFHAFPWNAFSVWEEFGEVDSFLNGGSVITHLGTCTYPITMETSWVAWCWKPWGHWTIGHRREKC